MPKIIHINFESQMALPTGLVVFTDVEYNNHAIHDGVY